MYLFSYWSGTCCIALYSNWMSELREKVKYKVKKVSTILRNGTPNSVKYLFTERFKNKPKQLSTLELLLWIGCRCIPSKYSAIIVDVLTIIATFTDYPELKRIRSSWCNMWHWGTNHTLQFPKCEGHEKLPQWSYQIWIWYDHCGNFVWPSYFGICSTLSVEWLALPQCHIPITPYFYSVQ